MAGLAPLAARKSKAAPEKKRPAPAKPKGQHEQDRSIALHPPPLSIRSARPPPVALLKKEEAIQAKLTVSEPDDELEKEADQVADKVMMRMPAAAAPMGDDDDEPIQTKLTVSEPNDPFEREADRVADQVMRMPDPGASAPVTAKSASSTASDDTELQRAEDEDAEEEPTTPIVQRMVMSAPIQRMCSSCSAESTDDEAETNVVQRACSKCDDEMNVVQRMCSTCSGDEEKQHVQTKPGHEGGGPPPGPSFAQRLRDARGAGGSPLPHGVRQFMEPRFGHDFGRVRIHTDARADSLSRRVSARAFTTGHDIFFRSGEFHPNSVGGRRLIAHELTHVVQQRGPKRPPSSAERLVIGSQSDSDIPIQRQPDDRDAFLRDRLARLEAKIKDERTRASVAKKGRILDDGARLRGPAQPKKLLNLLEERFTLNLRIAFPDLTFVEGVTLKGVRMPSGKFLSVNKLGKALGGADSKVTGKRIADWAQIKGNRVMLGDTKTSGAVEGSVQGGTRTGGPMEAQFTVSQDSLGGQLQKETDLLRFARRAGGKVVITAFDRTTGSRIRIEVDPGMISRSRINEYTQMPDKLLDEINPKPRPRSLPPGRPPPPKAPPVPTTPAAPTPTTGGPPAKGGAPGAPPAKGGASRFKGGPMARPSGAALVRTRGSGAVLMLPQLKDWALTSFFIEPENKRRVEKEIEQLQAVVNAHQEKNPEDWALLTVVYTNPTGRAGESFSRFLDVELRYGKSKRAALEAPRHFTAETADPRLEVTVQSIWVPPPGQADTGELEAPFPRLGDATFAKGREQLQDVEWNLITGLDDEGSSRIRLSEGRKARFTILKPPNHIDVKTPGGRPFRESIPLEERSSANGKKLLAVQLDTSVPLFNVAAVPVVAADEATAVHFDDAPATKDRHGALQFLHNFGIENVRWVRPENIEVLQGQAPAAPQSPATPSQSAGGSADSVQRTAAIGGGSNSPGPTFARSVARERASNASPLPKPVRRFMEPRFGRTFDNVRIHADEAANRLNEGIKARAFTMGSDVFFKRGELAPGTKQGDHLIAHELAHVVQQEAGTDGTLQRQVSTEPDEPMSVAEATEPPENLEPNASVPLEEVPSGEIAEAAEGLVSQAPEPEASEAPPIEEPSDQEPEVPTGDELEGQLEAQSEDALDLESLDSALEEAEGDLVTGEEFGEQAEQTVSEEPVPEGPIESIESEAMVKLRDQVTSHKVAVEADATTTKAGIEATAASEKERVAAALTAERAGLATTTAEQRTQLATAASAARASILASRDSEIAKTQQAADTEAGRLEKTIETKVSELSENARLKVEQGVDFSKKQAVRAETQTQANVAQTRVIAASVIKAFATSDRAARIQRVVNENAGAAAAQLLKMGGMLTEKVRFDGRAFADKISSDAQATGQSFREEVKPAALEKIHAERDKTIEGLNRMAETPLEQLAGLEEDLAERLESSQQDIDALLERLIAIASADIDTAATAAIAAVDAQTGLTLTELDSFVIQAESLLTGERPEVADPVLAKLSSSADEAVSGYHSELGRFVTQAQEGIAKRADTATNRSAERQGGDGSGLSQIGAAIEAKLAELSGNVATDMAGLTSAGTKNMAAVTTRTEQELGSIVQRKNTIWQDELNKDSASIAKTVDQGLKDQMDVLGPLRAELTAEAKKIDEESILMRILKTVGGFIVGVFSVAWDAFLGLVMLAIILVIAVVLVVGALVLIGLGGVFAVIGGIILAAVLIAALAFVVLAVASLVIGLVDGVTKFWDNITDSSLDDFDRSKGATEGGLDALSSAGGIITIVGGLLRGGISAARKLKIRLRFRTRTPAPRTLTHAEAGKELEAAEKAVTKANEAAERAARDSAKPGVEQPKAGLEADPRKPPTAAVEPGAVWSRPLSPEVKPRFDALSEADKALLRKVQVETAEDALRSVGRKADASSAPPGYTFVDPGPNRRPYLRRRPPKDERPPLHVDPETGEIRLGLGKSSPRLSQPGKLRSNMDPAPGPGHQAHHLVPDETVRKHELFVEARKHGYDLDRKSNGIYLAETPEHQVINATDNLPLHSGSHSNYTARANAVAKQALEEALEKAGKENVGQLSPGEILEAVAKVERRMDAIVRSMKPTEYLR